MLTFLLWLLLLSSPSGCLPCTPSTLGMGGDELSELEIDLRDRDKWTRKSAVEKLARLNSSEAWELVIEALADPYGEVADTAQFLLGSMEDPDGIELLSGRDGLGSKDEWVSRRCAEVLGRLKSDVGGKALLAAATAKDAHVRRAGLWSVERRQRAARLTSDTKKLLAALEKAATKDKDVPARVRAMHALAAVDIEKGRGVVTASSRDKRFGVRCAAASLAPRVFEPGRAAAFLAERTKDEIPAVRTAAVIALGRLKSAAAARELALCLERETELRLGWRILAELQALSGLKHGRDPRPWKDWATGLPDGWGPGEASSSETAEFGDRSIAFAGLPILSGRVTFLIDLSGSIWRERDDGRTRKEVVDERLAEVLAALPPTTRFNLIAFTGKPIPWRDELADATPKNVKQATEFFTELNASGTGNFWDAAMLALEDPEADTLVVLTDGAPTGGRRFHLDLIVPMFEERNASRMVAVDSLLVDASKKLQRYWADLAARTGGRSISIEL